METKTVLASMKDVIILLQSSKMEDDEKQMWLALLPQMDEQQIVHLAHILKKETDIYIDAFISTHSA